MNNFNKFIAKVAALVAVIFLSRAFFQFPVEYFGLSLFKQGVSTTVFNKILALEVFTFFAIFFGFYYNERIAKLRHHKFNLKSALLALLSAELCIAAYYGVRFLANVFSLNSGFWFYVAWIISLFILCVSLFYFIMAAFDCRYAHSFFKEFRDELLVSAIAGILFYFLLVFFQEQWFFFSNNVAGLLYFILSNFYPVSYFIDGKVPILQVADFSIAIGAPCSGIDSLFLFFAFFAAIFALDRKKLKAWLYLLFFIAGLIGVYFLNVLRLLLLVIVGVHISPEFAVGLFHTNAGWLLFAAYFLCYYLVIKRFIYMKSPPK